MVSFNHVPELSQIVCIFLKRVVAIYCIEGAGQFWSEVICNSADIYVKQAIENQRKSRFKFNYHVFFTYNQLSVFVKHPLVNVAKLLISLLWDSGNDVILLQ